MSINLYIFKLILSRSLEIVNKQMMWGLWYSQFRYMFGGGPYLPAVHGQALILKIEVSFNKIYL